MTDESCQPENVLRTTFRSSYFVKWAHFQSNSKRTLTVTLKHDHNSYTNSNPIPNPIHPTEPTNFNR